MTGFFDLNGQRVLNEASDGNWELYDKADVEEVDQNGTTSYQLVDGATPIERFESQRTIDEVVSALDGEDVGATTPLSSINSEEGHFTSTETGSLSANEYNTEISSSKYLSGDGSDESAAIQTMIEDAATNGPTRIRWESGTYVCNSTVAPTTDGTKVDIVGMGDVTVDATGIGTNAVLDFADAPNVNGNHITVLGSSGAGKYNSLVAGPQSTWRHITLDGGQGGFETNAGVVCEHLEVMNQRMTDQGYATGYHAIGRAASNFVLRYFDIHDCDRGVEIEDGASYFEIEKGVVENIDNTQATSPAAPFSLNLHHHTAEQTSSGSEPPCVDGTFRDITVRNSIQGLNLESHAEGLFDDIVAENIRCENIGDSHMKLNGDITVRDPTVVGTTDDGNRGIQITGGDVRVYDGSVSGGINFHGIQIQQGPYGPLGSIILNGLEIDGASNTSHGIDVVAPNKPVRISNVNVSNTTSTSIRGDDGTMTASGYGAILTDCILDDRLLMTDVSNTKVLVRGGIIPNVTTPTDSVVRDVA